MSNLLSNSNDKRLFTVNSLQTSSSAGNAAIEDIPSTTDQSFQFSTSNMSSQSKNSSKVDFVDLRGFGVHIDPSLPTDPGNFKSSSEQLKKRRDSSLDVESRVQRVSNSNYPNKLVRVDHSIQKIDSFFRATSDSQSSNSAIFCNPTFFAVDETESVASVTTNLIQCGACSSGSNPVPNTTYCACCCNKPEAIETRDSTSNMDVSSKNAVAVLGEISVSSCSYASIGSLMDHIYDDKDTRLDSFLRKQSFIGMINKDYSLVQFDTKLMMINHNLLLNHMFYQLCIFQFAEMDELVLEKEISIEECVRQELIQWKKRNESTSSSSSLSIPNEDMASNVAKVLIQKREMLYEYFRIGITDTGMLTALPNLIPRNPKDNSILYSPHERFLGCFFVVMVLETNWNEEKDCFRDVAIRIAEYYARMDTGHEVLEDAQIKFRDVLFPAMRKYLIPQKSFFSFPSAVLEVTALEQLYKIFERC